MYSIAAGGFGVRSYSTLATPGTFPTVLSRIFSIVSQESFTGFAVSASSTDPYLMAALRMLYREHGAWYGSLIPSVRAL